VLFKQKRYNDMLETYRSLLTYIKSAVTRNYSEKSINSILDYVSTSNEVCGGTGEADVFTLVFFLARRPKTLLTLLTPTQSDLLLQFYETTLEALQEAKNDRLWFKTNLKLGKMFLDREEYGKLAKTLKELHKACQTDEGTSKHVDTILWAADTHPDTRVAPAMVGEDDQTKGTQLLEVYALEIQMYTAQKDTKKLKVRLRAGVSLFFWASRPTLSYTTSHVFFSPPRACMRNRCASRLPSHTLTSWALSEVCLFDGNRPELFTAARHCFFYSDAHHSTPLQSAAEKCTSSRSSGPRPTKTFSRCARACFRLTQATKDVYTKDVYTHSSPLFLFH
jgi:hypothetical protein